MISYLDSHKTFLDLFQQMPGKVKVRILSGRHLPVMDRSSDTTDAFAEVKLGDTTYKTDVYRKSLNPNWNSEWFRFDVDGNLFIDSVSRF